MKTLKIEVTSDDKADQSVVGFYTERKQGDIWNRLDGVDGTTNRGPVTIKLEPGQRLVIDAFPPQEMIYDRDQGASINPATQKNPEKNRADVAVPVKEGTKPSEPAKTVTFTPTKPSTPPTPPTPPPAPGTTFVKSEK